MSAPPYSDFYLPFTSTKTGKIKHAKNLCVNVYFDPIRRTLELKKLADDLYDMQEELDGLLPVKILPTLQLK